MPHHTQKSVSRDSAARLGFGMESTCFGSYKEQSSYFIATLALREKIISSGLQALIWSTDHVDNNKLAEGAPFLTGYLGRHRRGAVHPSRCRGRIPPRSVVTRDVDRPHRRRTAPFTAAPFRPAA